MKKSLVFTLGLFITLIGIMSCGGGADDEARQAAIRDSLRNDSIMQAQAAQALADSLRNDSIMMAQQAYADSLAAALAATGKGGAVKPKAGNTGNTTTPPATTTTEPTKPLTGKDAIKGRDGEKPKSGKDAIKNRDEGTGTTKAPSGKDAIKGRNK